MESAHATRRSTGTGWACRSLLCCMLVSGAAVAQQPPRNFLEPAAAEEPSQVRSVAAETTEAIRTNPSWKAPRTPWGAPDLRGVWTSDDMRSVPINRPKSFGNRASLTPEELHARAAADEGARDRALHDEAFLGNETGTRTFGYASLIIDPADGRMPPLTKAAVQRMIDMHAANIPASGGGIGPFDSMSNFTLSERCITQGILGSIIPGVYGNGLRILQTPDAVVVSYEMIHATRVIPLDGAPKLDGAIRQFMGSSVGRWEGDTLVVEATNFTDRTGLGQYGDGPHNSQNMHLTERFTRVDPDMIDYVARVEDPDTYTQPFTIRMTITRQPGYHMYEYSCHEGNQFIRNAFETQRDFDAKVAEARAQGLPLPVYKHPGNSIYSTPDPSAKIFDVNSGH